MTLEVAPHLTPEEAMAYRRAFTVPSNGSRPSPWRKMDTEREFTAALRQHDGSLNVTEGLRRLHAAGKMHNRMICPTCREQRYAPARLSTSKPWQHWRQQAW